MSTSGGKGPKGHNRRGHHLWQYQPVRDVLVIATVLLVLYLGYLVSIVTVPLLLALLLAYLFEPVVRVITRVRFVSRQAAAVIIIAVAAVVVVVPVTIAVAFAAVQGVGYAQQLANNTGALLESIDKPEDQTLYEALPSPAWRNIRDYVVELGEGRPEDAPVDQYGRKIAPYTYNLIRFITTWVTENAEAIGKEALQTGRGALSAAFHTVASIGMFVFTGFLTAFFFFFISTGFARVHNAVARYVPDDKEQKFFELAHKMDRVIAGFVRGRLTIALIQSAFFTLGYWMIGVPAPLILGPVVGILAIVPYIAMVGIPISIVLLWLEPSSIAWQNSVWWVVGAPIGVYALGQALDDYVLTPTIQGKSTNMDVPTILFATIAGGSLAGIYGMLLAIPVAACVKILLTDAVWPRVKDWKEGKAADPLPFGDDVKK